MGVMLLLLLLSVALNLLKPWPVAWLIDYLLKNTESFGYRWLSNLSWTPASVVAGLALATLGLHLAHPVIAALHSGSLIRLGLLGLSRVREELLLHLQRLPWGFHQRIPSGDLIYRASWDTYSIQTLFQQGLGGFLSALLSLILMVGIMGRMDGVLTGIALATAPCVILVIRFLGPGMGRLGAKAQQTDSQVTSRVQQLIQTLPLIQSFTRETEEGSIFTRLIRDAREDRWRQHRAELLYGLAIAAVFATGMGLLVWFGGDRVLAGRLTAGQLIVFLAYLAQFYEPLNQLSHVGSTLASAGAGTRRIFEILESPAEPPDPARPAEFPNGASPGGIAFEDVTFGYRAGELVLNGITFQVEQGDLVAILGPSGAGKSTLLHLLPRFFDPERGRVLMGGIDLREFRRHDLRSRVALALQEPLLLQGTLAENIAFGRAGATRAEIEEAARAAAADEFISRLERGYDTVVGDGSQRLSVGEKQRINLARAFLKKAPILVLDEPTSSLDAGSERQVVASLKAGVGVRTTFMVAHRLQTIQVATKVLVLDRGKVVEFGTPEALLQKQGYLASVYRPGSFTN